MVVAAPGDREDDTWAIFLLSASSRAAPADGRTNPIEYAYVVGIGGKGVVPARERDSFGVGWARTEFSDDFVLFLRQQLLSSRSGDREDAVGIYYNAALTHWLDLTFDVGSSTPTSRRGSRRPGSSEHRPRSSWFGSARF
jgi:carbohydrate-selective porin OprB